MWLESFGLQVRSNVFGSDRVKDVAKFYPFTPSDLLLTRWKHFHRPISCPDSSMDARGRENNVTMKSLAAALLGQRHLNILYILTSRPSGSGRLECEEITDVTPFILFIFSK
jgi:hypothetical protein